MKRAVQMALAMLSLSIAGCGTCAVLALPSSGDQVFYQGVKLDMEAVKEGGPMVLIAADIPLSAIADTIMAPFLIPVWLHPPEKCNWGTMDRLPGQANACPRDPQPFTVEQPCRAGMQNPPERP
jgi:uncharacterized protein YceK